MITCRCSKCGDEFTARAKRGYCNPCNTLYAKNRRNSVPNVLRSNTYKQRYNLRIKGYDELFKAQKGVCAICQQFETNSRVNFLGIDHDHKTGEIRGLLCHNCNSALGFFKDDPKILKRAKKYLEDRL